MCRQNGVTPWTASTLCPTIDTKALVLCRRYAQNKVQKHHSQRIPWLLVAISNTTLDFSHYSARLVEERKKKERWTILIFGRFRFAPLKWLLYVAITTVDWGKPFKLLWVLLDASICSQWWYRRENANILIGAAILKSATSPRAHNMDYAAASPLPAMLHMHGCATASPY